MTQTNLDENERTRLEARHRILVRAIAASVVSVGCLVLAGWIFGIEILVQGRPGYNHMRFNTALCLVVSGVALWLTSIEGSEWRCRLAQFCGLFVFIVALSTLMEQTLGWDLHIDQLLWKDIWSASQPGRMVPITAICFGLVGIFLIFSRAERASLVGVAQFSAVLANLAAQWAVLDVIFRSDKASRVAIHTSLMLLVFSMGMLLTPCHEGFLAPLFGTTSGGRMLRRLLPTAILVPLAVGWMRWAAAQSDLIGDEAGIAIMVVVYSATLMAVILRTARSSDLIELERLRVQQKFGSFFSLPMHSLMAIVGVDGYFKQISPSWMRVLGYTEKELLARPYPEFVDPEDRAAVAARQAEIMAGQSAIDFEIRLLTRNGERRWLRWNVAMAESGLMYAIGEDVTDRKQAELELRRASLYARSLLEASLDPLVTISKDGKITDVNRATEQVTGVARERLIGNDFLNYFSDSQKARQGYEQVFAQGEVRNYPLEVRHTSGALTPVLYNASVFKNERGEVEGVFAAARDITEVRRVEQALQESQRHLEQHVMERTEQLAAANKELESFAYSVSHDLRAPLRHLDGFLGLLRGRCYEVLDEGGRHYIDIVLSSSRRLGALIDDLLQFSRLGRAAIRRAPVQPNEIIVELRQELQEAMQDRKVCWNVGPLPAVAADRGMFRQIFQNLLDNALKFTRTREAAEITIAGSHDADGNVVISVADNGVGFDMAYYNKLFQVFQRLHGEDAFEGTGIGLANVRKIVERHGGRVWAQSTLGKGAIFYVSLPPAGTIEAGEEHEPVEAHIAG